MALAVNFDDKPRGGAIEVDDASPDWMLSPKLQSTRPLSQRSPKNALRQRHVSPQRSRLKHRRVLLSGWWHLTPPPSCGWFPSPSPDGEEIYWASFPFSAIAGSAAGARQLHVLCFAGGGAVATNSAGESQPFRPPAASNFSIPLAAYSGNDSAPL